MKKIFTNEKLADDIAEAKIYEKRIYQSFSCLK